MSAITANYTSGQNLLAGLNSFLTVGHTLPPVYATANSLSSVTPGTGWSGSLAAGFTHASGNTAALTESTTYSVGSKYTLTIGFTSYTSGSISYSVGGFSSTGITANLTRCMIFSASTHLTITPTADFVGTITISVTKASTHDGYIDDAIGTANSVYETFTIALTSPTAFTVVGSVSGSLGTGTVGTTFTDPSALPKISFTLNYTSHAFAAGDIVILQMTVPWTSIIAATGSQYIWSAPGNDNNGGPTVGLLCYSSSTTNYFNAQVVGYPTWQTAFAASESNQFKRYAGAYWTLGPSAGQSCTLYAVADGQFCYAVCLIGSTYSSACLGWMRAVHGTDQHPQPLLIGANAKTLVQWSDSSCRGPVFAQQNSSWSLGGSYVPAPAFSYAFLPSSRWAGLNGYDNAAINNEPGCDYINVVYNRTGSRQQVNLDGSVPFLPVTILTASGYANPNYHFGTGIWGYFPFVYMIPCYASDATLIGGGAIIRNADNHRRYITIQNCYVTDSSNTYALEMA